jgi:hypothetical protein
MGLPIYIYGEKLKLNCFTLLSDSCRTTANAYCSRGQTLVYTHHAEVLVDPKVRVQKTRSPEHVNSEKRNRQISFGPPLPLPTFFNM